MCSKTEAGYRSRDMRADVFRPQTRVLCNDEHNRFTYLHGTPNSELTTDHVSQTCTTSPSTFVGPLIALFHLESGRPHSLEIRRITRPIDTDISNSPTRLINKQHITMLRALDIDAPFRGSPVLQPTQLPQHDYLCRFDEDAVIRAHMRRQAVQRDEDRAPREIRRRTNPLDMVVQLERSQRALPELS